MKEVVLDSSPSTATFVGCLLSAMSLSLRDLSQIRHGKAAYEETHFSVDDLPSGLGTRFDAERGAEEGGDWRAPCTLF